ncbi:hypothetical protein [Rothia mucilaginosa]|uniref:hypothetical protein n=1 Tax=Rothia mucilaginosa TaxID=43675 RepID=UPI00288B6742|nr:hypothetical protein [Rothia mucilaginosa]
MTTKTKRDRAAGRQHRHTAIQTIVSNHQGIIDDIASIDNSIACLQDETCNLGSRLDNWYTILDEKNTHTRQNVAYTMRCVVENERKAAEVESAVGILQEFSRQQVGINTKQVTINKMTHGMQKEQQKAIAQLIAYTDKVNDRADALQEELDETNKRLFQLAWITVGLWAIAAITIFALLIVP